MSQIIDIILEHEGEQFTFTARVTGVDDVEHKSLLSDCHGLPIENVRLKPLTPIDAIADYLPDAEQQPVELSEADLQARQFYIDCYNRNLDLGVDDSTAQSLAFKALTNLREAFNEQP
jgi:hypothetical protein